jgi:hypothetical protein
VIGKNTFLFNSTFDSNTKTAAVAATVVNNDLGNQIDDYFELNSINPINTSDLTILTEKNFELLNSDDESTPSSSSESFCLEPQLTKKKMTSSSRKNLLFRSMLSNRNCINNNNKSHPLTTSFRNKTVLRSKLNRYLKSRSLVMDHNASLNCESFDQYLAFMNELNSKNKKFRSKYERFSNANKFYKRQQRKRTSTIKHSLSSTSIGHLSLCETNPSTYKPSVKVEKLLNDTRGMRKYLIDYEFLMSNKTNFTNETTKQINDSLLFEKFRSSFLNENSMLDSSELIFQQTSSNRCSSGYLSDC